MDKMAVRVSGIIFLLMGIAHVLRVVFKVSVEVNGHLIPLWSSIVGSLVAFALATWIFRSSK